MLTESEKAEIRSEYRGAKDPGKQIAISSQLHNCTAGEVRAALEGMELPKDNPKREKKEYGEAFKAQVIAAVKAGGTVKKVAEENGIAAVTINRWISQASARGKRAAVEETPPSQIGPSLSRDTVSAILDLLSIEVNRWTGVLKDELLKRVEVNLETLEKLRAALLMEREFFQFATTKIQMENGRTDNEKAEMDS